MIDNVKLARLLELKDQHEAIEAEINELLGGEAAKPKRHRRTKAELEAAKLPQAQL